MADATTIKTAFERNVNAMAHRPKVALKTAVCRVRTTDGLTCEIEEGDWRLVSDLSPKTGGNGEGPDPGVMGRAALGSCLAIGYKLWAAKMEIPLETVEVEVEADFDARGQYGWDDIPPGYTEVRYHVRLTSDAPQKRLLELVETAEKYSSYLDVFLRENKMSRRLSINDEVI